MTSNFKINQDHERWIKNARQKYKQTAEFWRKLIQDQEGKCELSHIKLLFDAENGTCKKSGHGCHPLYASVDHKNPSREDHGFQIICYDINDLKGHLPIPLFEALKKTPEWRRFVEKWKKLPPDDIKGFKGLIKRGH